MTYEVRIVTPEPYVSVRGKALFEEIHVYKNGVVYQRDFDGMCLAADTSEIQDMVEEGLNYWRNLK